jgi:hypothetical protein
MNTTRKKNTAGQVLTLDLINTDLGIKVLSDETGNLTCQYGLNGASFSVGTGTFTEVKNALGARIGRFAYHMVTAETNGVNGDFLITHSNPNYAVELITVDFVDIGAIDTLLSATHGAGLWGSGETYSNTITIITQDTNNNRIPNVDITFKNENGEGIQKVKTDLNGDGSTTLPSDTVDVVPWCVGYTFTPSTETIDGDTTITITGEKIVIPVPSPGLQNISAYVYHPNGNGPAVGAIMVADVMLPSVANQIIMSNQITSSVADSTGLVLISVLKGARVSVKIMFGGMTLRNKSFTVTTDDIMNLEDYA